MKVCSYYQAKVQRKDTWFLVGLFRSFEHLLFDRTIDKERGIIEFFIPEDLEQYFLQVMEYFQQEGIVSDLEKMPNRLLDPKEEI